MEKKLISSSPIFWTFTLFQTNLSRSEQPVRQWVTLSQWNPLDLCFCCCCCCCWHGRESDEKRWGVGKWGEWEEIVRGKWTGAQIRGTGEGEGVKRGEKAKLWQSRTRGMWPMPGEIGKSWITRLITLYFQYSNASLGLLSSEFNLQFNDSIICSHQIDHNPHFQPFWVLQQDFAQVEGVSVQAHLQGKQKYLFIIQIKWEWLCWFLCIFRLYLIFNFEDSMLIFTN